MALKGLINNQLQETRINITIFFDHNTVKYYIVGIGYSF